MTVGKSNQAGRRNVTGGFAGLASTWVAKALFMPITFLPKVGAVLMCELGPDPRNIQPPGVLVGPLAVWPEIWKNRHAVVVQPKATGTCLVVPISTLKPQPAEDFHHRLPAGTYPFLDRDRDSWVKGDLLSCISRSRPDRVLIAGRYSHAYLAAEDLKAVQRCVLCALGLQHLSTHLADAT